MVGVPYVVLGVVGFCVYRGVKKNEQFRLTRDMKDDGPEA
jgi:hypothetical protein